MCSANSDPAPRPRQSAGAAELGPILCGSHGALTALHGRGSLLRSPRRGEASHPKIWKGLMAAVEQIKLKRAGTGLRALDHAQAEPGLTLFAPMTAEQRVYLIDLGGNVRHTWEMPYPPGLYGSLTPRGTLLYNGKVLEARDRFIGEQPWKGGALLEVD